MLTDYQPLYDSLADYPAEQWLAVLPEQIADAFAVDRHGDLRTWLQVIQGLPEIEPSIRSIDTRVVTIGHKEDIDHQMRQQLQTGLQQLHPWRKGPYDLFGIAIESEWRSDWKWQRLERHITSLKNRLVLDVGCGNGYHCWRMLGAGAKMVVGIDPGLLSNMQFQAIRKLYAAEVPLYILPLGIEQLPYGMHFFDTVFSMGVFYHRRSPVDHLLELRDCLRPGGELVLETLVIEGQQGDVLLPPGRYAKMRNVWFIPSTDTLMGWMQRCGFFNIRLVDVTRTTVQEQRGTEWMHFHSLQDFLDPDNPDLTVEGLPAPCRAIIIANVK